MASVPVLHHLAAQLAVTAAATAAVAEVHSPGWEGTRVTGGNARPGKKEGVWFSYLSAVTLAREQPRCQSLRQVWGTFQPI